jgi:hypothetical protein
MRITPNKLIRGREPLVFIINIIIMIEIIIISKTIVEIERLLRLVKGVTGSYPIKNKSEDPNLNYINILNGLFDNYNHYYYNNAYQHIIYGIMILGSKDFFYKLMQYQNIITLNITNTLNPECDLGIATASLLDWKELIVKCSSGKEDIRIRELANKLQSLFEASGFHSLFKGYCKERNNPLSEVMDNTYKLNKIK